MDGLDQVPPPRKGVETVWRQFQTLLHSRLAKRETARVPIKLKKAKARGGLLDWFPDWDLAGHWRSLCLGWREA